jgi:hypothetical protein
VTNTGGKGGKGGNIFAIRAAASGFGLERATSLTIGIVPRSNGLADLLRDRAEAYRRFEEWEVEHPMRLTPAASVAAVGELYALLPAGSRRRAVDPSGVARLHDALRRVAR